MSEIILNDKDSFIRRFCCDCCDPTHALDIYIDRFNKNEIMIEFSTKYLNNDNFMDKIKKIWKIIKKQELYDHDFILRPDDKEFIKIALEGK